MVIVKCKLPLAVSDYCSKTNKAVLYMNMRSYSCCDTSHQRAGDIRSLSIVLKVVAEENRLRILCVLKQGEHCVCELLDHLGMSQSLLSHHLRDLKDVGLVVDDKRGTKVFYALTTEGERLVSRLLPDNGRG